MAREDTAAVLAREFAALNTATERAHAVLADLRTERQLLSGLLVEIREASGERAEALIIAALEPRIEAMNTRIGEAMREAVARVDREIDRYLALALGADAYSRIIGRPPLPEVVAEARRRGVI